MKLRILLINLVVLLTFNMQAQTKGKKKTQQTHTLINGVEHVHDEHGCTLYANDRHSDVFIPFGIQKPKDGEKSGNAPDAFFDVDYIGFTPEAQSALQFAFDELSKLITSPVPIRVEAVYENFTGTNLEGALGGSNAVAWYVNDGVVYPSPIAEKIAGRDFGGDDDGYDIRLGINSDADWHFDPTDNTTIGNKYDLATVMMHEIIHGLGFTGLLTGRNGQTGLFYVTGTNGEVDLYVDFVEDNNGVPLIEKGANESDALASAMTSGQLFFVVPTLDNKAQKVFSPLNWSGGSSIFHLDETATDSIDFLMTPFASRGEIRSDPGVTTQMLKDMGWDFTTIMYEQDENHTEDLTQALSIAVSLITDSGFDTSSVSLVYSQDEFVMDSTTITMIYNPSTDKFEADIPAPNAEIVYHYKIELNQNHHTITKISAPVFLRVDHYVYAYIKDAIPPVIEHSDLQNVNSSDLSFEIKASVVDSFANDVVFNASAEVDTVYIEYAINDGALVTEGAVLSTDGFGEFYLASGSLPSGLTVDDVLTYRIIAVDASEAANSSMFPADGSFISVPVVEVFDPVVEYTNDFNDLSGDDFSLDRFQVGLVNGFEDGVLMNRDHTYRTAGNGNTINFSATLKAPIIIAADSASAFIKFKEIVLVEPGESGTSFGETEFWDYVIIEAKKLSGGDWEPLLDGYDSGEQPTWRSTYNANIQFNNSTGVPNQNMYRAKEISFLGGDSPFVPSDTVLVRFRLFSDPAAAGWGWMIENLNIQNPDINVAVEDFIETNDFVVYPNPTSTGMINVSARFTKSAKNLSTELRDIHGRLINVQRISDGAKAYDNSIDVSSLPAGIYFMTLRDNESAITKKVVKY